MADLSTLRDKLAPLHGVAAMSTVSGAERPGVVVRELAPGLALHVIAQRGKEAAVAAALAVELGVVPPDRPAITLNRDCAAVWCGPGQWLLMAPRSAGTAFRDRVTTAAGSSAALIEQSDSRVYVSLHGPKVRQTLEKLVGIDIDESVFASGAAAMTAMAHIAVHVWREADRDGCPAFVIAGPQSMAGSLWHHIVVAAAEFGLDARPLG